MDTENAKSAKPQFTPLLLRSSEGSQEYGVGLETLIGREAECNICLDSPHISRYHAKISLLANGATLEDLHSANGTFVNGKRIQEKTRISVGDEITFDSLAFRLVTAISGETNATVLNRSATLNQPRLSATQDTEAQSNTEAPSNQNNDDRTYVLSNEEIHNIADINKRFQKFIDTGSGPRLVAATAPIRGKVFQLNPRGQDRWTLGRSKEHDIVIADPSVSRHHATIEKLDGRFRISLEAQSKEIMLNGAATREAILRHNDELLVGHMEFIFRFDDKPKITSAETTLKTAERVKFSPALAASVAILGLIAITMIVTLLAK